MQLTPNKKLVIVGISSLIIGVCLASIVYTVRGLGYRKDFRDRAQQGILFNRQNGQYAGQMGMHRMPDGSFMPNMMGTATGTMAGMMQGMVANLQGKKGKDLEKAFLVEMIPHHQGAVEMAKLLVADPTVSPELKAFAQGIITAQEGEIDKMNVWVRAY